MAATSHGVLQSQGVLFRETFRQESAVVLRMWGLLSLILLSQTAWSQEVTDRKAQYRELATAQDGDAVAGKQIFDNANKAACVKCHSVDGSRRGVGPDLGSIGSKFERAGLIQSILDPSSSIAIGYGITIVVTDSGQTYQGVLQRVTDEFVELKDKDSKTVRIETRSIEEQRESSTSLMPERIETLIDPQEFVDLVAYLQSLKQVATVGSSQRGEIQEADRCKKGLDLVPRFREATFIRPVAMEPVPGQKSQFVVIEHGGAIYWLDESLPNNEPLGVLDLARTVRLGGATGLLGLAFHPQFAQNQRVFLKYQIDDRGRITTIVEERRWSQSENQKPQMVEPKEILRIVGATQDHNGGSLGFGPDGYLYLGMGDSGPQRDPRGHGQDLKTLLGKILRIDIDRPQEPLAYGIPADNPFAKRDDARPEIWAYGFREPWRFSFDRVTKELWVGDVGQDRFEEVAVVGKGENHGWNVFEGFSPFSNQYQVQDRTYVEPVLSYPRSLGVSVTAGFVYRGTRAPQLAGWYIFGDFESRRIWALQQKDKKLTRVVEIGRAPTRVVSFTEDSDGELALVGYDNGIVYRMDLSKVDLTPVHRRMLADTSEQSPVLWRYTNRPPAAGWEQSDFDDSSWRSGPGGFGTAGTPGSVVRTDWRSSDIWLRRKFTLNADVDPTTSMSLRIHHDEDAEIFINGREVARLGRWTSSYVEINLDRDAIASLKKGENTIAIHCHQNTGGQYIDCGLVEFVVSPK